MSRRNLLECLRAGIGPASGRAIARLIAAVGITLLAGCQTAPQKEVVAQPPPQQTLRSLGFVETQEGWLLNLAVPILFETDSDLITPDMTTTIAKIADDLMRTGIKRIRVEGHTDNVGDRRYNIELSRRRADSVARTFVASGFPEDGIARRGLGFDFPAASNATPDGRALNRRVTIVVSVEDLPPR
jgi:outer membrane protein OmpA-like peptidoglycan-associated protein